MHPMTPITHVILVTLQHPIVTVILVTVCGYEHDPPRGIGGVSYTIFRVVRTCGRTYIRRSATINAHPKTSIKVQSQNK